MSYVNYLRGGECLTLRKKFLQFGIGKCYFHLGYYDRNLSIPFVEPFFFLGRDLFSEGLGFFFFQGAVAYLDGEKLTSFDACDQKGVILVGEDDLDIFVEWSGLLSELNENKKMQDQGHWYSAKRY